MIGRSQASIQFGAGEQPSPSSVATKKQSRLDWLYRQALKTYHRPDEWQAKADAIAKGAALQSNPLARLSGKMKAAGLRFARLWTQFDYHEQSVIHLGRNRKVSIVNIPFGVLLLLLYASTIPPRAYLAYRRGKKDNDYREVGDVLRRDVIAITMFVFAMNRVTKWLGKLTQNYRKINLFDAKGSMLSYSQFKNYRITTLSSLKSILHEGENEIGLLRAVNGLHDQGVARLTGDHRYADSLNVLKERVRHLESLPKAVAGRADAIRRDTQIEAVYKSFKDADKLREEVRTELLLQNAPHAPKLAKELGEDVSGTLEKYARRSRLPSDMVSFAFVAVLIGWFPVWFNKTWNQFQYKRSNDSSSPASPTLSQPPLPIFAAATPAALRAPFPSPYQNQP